MQSEQDPAQVQIRAITPFLILHGDRDTLVPFAQGVELADLLAKAGVPVTLQRLPGAGHGDPAFGFPAVTRLTEAFFDKHLKAQTSRSSTSR